MTIWLCDQYFNELKDRTASPGILLFLLDNLEVLVGKACVQAGEFEKFYPFKNEGVEYDFGQIFKFFLNFCDTQINFIYRQMFHQLGLDHIVHALPTEIEGEVTQSTWGLFIIAS